MPRAGAEGAARMEAQHRLDSRRQRLQYRSCARRRGIGWRACRRSAAPAPTAAWRSRTCGHYPRSCAAARLVPPSSPTVRSPRRDLILRPSSASRSRRRARRSRSSENDRDRCGSSGCCRHGTGQQILPLTSGSSIKSASERGCRFLEPRFCGSSIGACAAAA